MRHSLQSADNRQVDLSSLKKELAIVSLFRERAQRPNLKWNPAWGPGQLLNWSNLAATTGRARAKAKVETKSKLKLKPKRDCSFNCGGLCCSSSPKRDNTLTLYSSLGVSLSQLLPSPSSSACNDLFNCESCSKSHLFCLDLFLDLL